MGSKKILKACSREPEVENEVCSFFYGNDRPG